MSVLYNSFISQTAKMSFALAVFLLLSISVAYAQTTRYVTPTGAGAMDGSSWANASSDLQATINASATGDNVWVATGTYKPTLGPFGVVPSDPRDKTFYVKDGVKIYGGFAGTETLLTQRNIPANITTLSGDFNSNDAVSGSGSTLSITGNTENAYHVVLASTAAVGGLGVTVDGFSIIGGNASLNTVVLGVNGNNVARDNGGGIFTTNGTNTLTNNLIYNNAAANGGGIFTRNGLNSTISNNTIYNNATSINGGGIFTTNGTDMVTNNTIYGNKTAIRGGGVHVAGINAINTFANNTFYNNNGTSGGAFYTTDANNTLINNTFYNNNANNGAGIFTVEGTNTISNNILWGSGSSIADYYYVNGPNGNTFTNNLLQLAASNYPTDASLNYGIGTGASGNIFAQDPLFVNATDIDGADNIHRTADDGLRLQVGSPAINTGDNTGVAATDITGAARIQATTVDMGAYEGVPIVCEARRGTWID